MATKVHMEALSPTMEEGQVVKWFKSEGDAVTNGEILAEIETDKATMELVARGDGLLRKILKEAGTTVPVGEVIAVIGGADEDISALVGGAGASAPAAEAAPSAHAPAQAPAEAQSSASESAPAAAAPAPPAADAVDPGGRVKASPLARRLAAEEGVELANVRGSGPGGRIVKRDVEQAVEKGVPASGTEGATAPASAGVPTGAPAFTPRPYTPESGEDYRDLPLTQIRKTIAKRLVESIGPVPHFFLTTDIDMTRVAEARERVNALLEKSGVKVSFNDIVLKSVAMALRRHPECNAHWGGDHIRQFNRVHIAVAVAVPDGLITPVIRDTDRKGLAEIASEVRELAGRAREKKLKPEEYTGSTFSISNLGMFGIRHFTGVINPPEAAILAVGSVEERAVVVNGQVVPRTIMSVTMSCDHRVIDGAQGSRFLQTLKGMLEEPLAALV